MTREPVDVSVLSEITLLQSTVLMLPDMHSRIDFIQRGLQDLPGIYKVEYHLEYPEQEQRKDILQFVLAKNEHFYVSFSLHVADESLITPYIPFIRNLMNMLTIVFEENRQKEENERLNEQLEQMVQQKTSELQEIFDFVPIGIGVTDKKGNILKVNTRFLEMFGYAHDEIPTVELWKQKTFPDEESQNQMAQQWIHDVTSIEGTDLQTPSREYRVINKAGAMIDIEITAKMGKGHLIVAFNDVSEREQNRAKLRQGQKMRVIGQLAGGVAHDFNNMLVGIIGNAELLLQMPQNEKSKSYILTILEAADRAADLASNLLAFSRQQQPRMKEIAFHELIEKTVKILTNTIPKNIEISQKNMTENDRILGDDSQLQSALMNLMINATHAMPHGGEIVLSTEEEILTKDSIAPQSGTSPGDYLKISIKDTGKGIPPENLDKIFEPFFTTKEKGKGTGLGLSAVYGIIQQHKGSISVQSHLNQGTEMTLRLPLIEEL